MLVDHKRNLLKYSRLVPYVHVVHNFLEENKSKKPSESISIGHNLKAIFLASSSYQEGIFESHLKYFDLHVVRSGMDVVRTGDTSQMKQFATYKEHDDYALWEGAASTVVTLSRDYFVFLQPEDAHNSQFIAEGTSKFVFKIPILHD
jgi:YhcH/YjgK/YiaL family protein